QWRAIASANGARLYGSLMAGGVQNGRMQAVIAAMVENVSRGKTKRGKDFARADFSDSSGQFSAACFEETLVDPLARWAKEGTCVLLTVELDSPSPEEPPRITVRGARPLSEVTSAARMILSLEIDRIEAVPELVLALTPGAEGRGEVKVKLRTGGVEEPTLRLGDSFALDGQLAERLATVDGITNVSLTASNRAANLRLVA
ncbi:MAG: dnaE1, partial [Novosphingobium sp.]|nr:dnaE1 [Novosphingobium sp.]